MRAEIVNAELTYEERFHRPIFKVASEHLDFLQAIFDSLSKRIALSSNNLEVRGANSLSDITLRLAGLNGLATASMTPDGWRADVRGIHTEADIALARDIFGYVKHPISKRVPFNSVQTRTFHCISHFRVLDSEFDPQDFVGTLVAPDIHVDPRKHSAPAATYGVTIGLENIQGGRISKMHLERSYRHDAHLFVTFADYLSDDPKWDDVAECFDNARKTLASLLDRIGIDVGKQ